MTPRDTEEADCEQISNRIDQTGSNFDPSDSDEQILVDLRKEIRRQQLAKEFDLRELRRHLHFKATVSIFSAIFLVSPFIPWYVNKNMLSIVYPLAMISAAFSLLGLLFVIWDQVPLHRLGRFIAIGSLFFTYGDLLAVAHLPTTGSTPPKTGPFALIHWPIGVMVTGTLSVILIIVTFMRWEPRLNPHATAALGTIRDEREMAAKRLLELQQKQGNEKSNDVVETTN